MSDDQITAYHGSPHDFDQFDTSKIGTGEGAQAYGHGLYFAEHEPIAIGYRDALTNPDQVPLHFEGKPLDTPWNEEIRERWPHHFEGKSESHQDAMEELLGNLSQVNNIDQIKHVFSSLSPKAKSLYQTTVSKKITKPDLGKGHMYEVHIAAHPDHFLDWDKPIKEQPHIINAINQHIGDPNSVLEHLFGHSDVTGGDFHEKLGGQHKPKAVAEKLASMGIKGIRYLDAGSRGPTDQPTHNYVVFDHNRVKVKRRYKKGGEVEAYGDGGHIPVGDPRREENLARHMEGNHPMVPHVLYHGTDITKAKGGTIDRENVDYKKMPHSPIVEHVLGKISAPLPALDSHLMAAIAGRRS